jgi:hypothetical protein
MHRGGSSWNFSSAKDQTEVPGAAQVRADTVQLEAHDKHDSATKVCTLLREGPAVYSQR